MRIKMTCLCGEWMSIDDDRGTYINDGGKPDEHGRVFVIQKYADDWLIKHKETCEEHKVAPKS